MKILVDINILLDVAQQRAPHLAGSDRVLKWCEAHPRRCFLAWHSVSNVYFLLAKQAGDSAAREFIATMLDIFEIAEAGRAAAKHALALPMSDFEDALQAAAAVQAGVDFIVTRDVTDFLQSPIPALLPADFLAQIPA